MAALFNVSVAYFNRDIRPLIPDEAVQKSKLPGRPRLFRGRAVIDAWHEHRVARDRVASTSGTVESELLGEAAASTPSLERYRLIRAKREELKHQQDQLKWIKREEVHNHWAVIASVLRSAGEAVTQQFGNEAGSLVEAALADAERVLTERIPAAAAAAGIEIGPGAMSVAGVAGVVPVAGHE